MKKILIPLAAIVFSILFFDKAIGLNLSLFSMLTVIVLLAYNPKILKINSVWLSAYLLTAIAVFVNQSYLAIFSNCFMFFTLVGQVANSNGSIYVKWINGIYTAVAGFFHRSFEVNDNESEVKLKKDIDVLHWIKLIGIPLFFVILFVLLYKNGNPVFNDLISEIDFGFVNFQWLLFAVSGYFLFKNISEPLIVEPLTTLDLNASNDLNKTKIVSEEKLKQEKQLGTTLIGLLNALILFYIITDIYALMKKSFSTANSLSNSVHLGIYTLIVSIVIAIIIILYFFRGNLNFYAHNKVLKNATYLWILLNAILVVQIAIKNQIYISNYGLTYKRIGVHVYILLTLIGLITTFIKVSKIKNITFLFRINVMAAFTILIIASTINWDNSITKYNLQYSQHCDVNYLINLSNKNAILLYDNIGKKQWSENQKNRIIRKYNNYLSLLEDIDWQEWSYEAYNLIQRK